MKNTSGLESIAYGLIDGDGQVFTNFPGYQSHKLFSLLGGKQTSTNEKIAYEIAWGSSLAGKRSAVMFKNVGLNDAADPFLNSMLVGVNAGLVLVVFDDVFVEGSQSRQDSRHYFDFYKGLWFEPYSVQNAYEVAYKSFGLSEGFKLPVVIRVTNQLVESFDTCKRKKKITKSQLSIKQNHEQFVIHPVNSKFQRKTLSKKNLPIQKYVDGLYKKIAIKNSKKNLLVLGCSRNEESKYLESGYNKIQIYTYPLPNSLKKVVETSNSLIVLEQGDDFIYQKIREFPKSPSNRIISNTGFIPDKSNGYIITKNYEKIFSVLKSLKPNLVIGDLGEYTKDNLDTIDACLSFGSSPAVAIGCNLAGIKKVVSIIGDAAYLHSGKNSILEAIEKNIPLKIIVVCNGGSQETGGQQIPGELYYQPKGVDKLKINYKKASKTEIKTILTKFMKSENVSVLYLEM